MPDEKSCSTATALADLDGDGDLDIVVNNVNSTPSIYINQTDATANYLKIKFKYSQQNNFGIGTKVYSYHKGIMQLKEMYTVRGFQASSEPMIHFGYGENAIVDSIKVIWPNGKAQLLTRIKTNQTLTISPAGTDFLPGRLSNPRKHMFEEIDQQQLGITYAHREDSYTDFDRLKLLPYQQCDRGPATAIGDINNDGMLDIYFGGSKAISGQVFMRTDSGYSKAFIPSILRDSIKEDVDAVIEDFNGDGKKDLFIGTGGADFYNKSKPLLDSYYVGSDSSFSLQEIADYYENASCVKSFDFDKDGDIDLFVGNESVSNDFGKVPKSYLLLNEKGVLVPTQKDVFENLGMVTDAVWDDYNQDGQVDLVIVGEWMEPTFLKNNNGLFEKDDVLDEALNGLWQSISPFDINGDGKTDYIVGNWGLNSKFRASQSRPMKMYYSDFDENGKSETIVTIEKQGKYYPLDGLDVMASQMASLRKKYLTYESFAGQDIKQLFASKQLGKATVYEVHQLASGYLKNVNGKFEFIQLPIDLQISPIMAQLVYDFDSDGKQEVLLGGNYFGVQPFHGRYGSFPGAVIKNEKEILDGKLIGLNLFNQSVRHFNVLSVGNENYLLVTINNGKAQLYKLQK